MCCSSEGVVRSYDYWSSGYKPRGGCHPSPVGLVEAGRGRYSERVRHLIMLA